MKTTSRPIFWTRLQFGLKCAATAVAKTPADYLNFFGLRRSLVATAIREARGENPTGLLDSEREAVAALENEALFCPITYTGNRRLDRIRFEIAAWRATGQNRIARQEAA